MTTDVATASPKKIMHVVLSMAMGGAEMLVYNMVRHSSSGNRPIVCCLQSIGVLGKKLQEEGFRIYNQSHSGGVDWGLIHWLRNIMIAEKIEVVHAHQYTALFYAAPAALWAGRIKLIYTEHGRLFPDIRHWKRYLVNPLLALAVDHFVSISSSTAQAMAEIDNFPRRRIQVIHNGIDFSRMNPVVDLEKKKREFGIRENCKIIGTAARLEEIKNIPMMLRALSRIRKVLPETCMIIAGHGSQEANLKLVTSELGLGDHVKFIGLRHDMPEIYKLMDVFLLTSFTEGISITLLEAMASGLPSVVTDVGGNPEVVVQGETGILVPSDDDRELATCILSLLQSSERAQQMGRRAMECAVSRFSFQGMMNHYSNLYN